MLHQHIQKNIAFKIPYSKIEKPVPQFLTPDTIQPFNLPLQWRAGFIHGTMKSYHNHAAYSHK